MSFLFRAFWVAAFVSSVAVATFSQLPVDKSEGPLVDASKPPVYIEFVRSGQCKMDGTNFNFGDICASKDKTARTFDAAWLRIVNNSRWSVGLTVDKAPTEKNSLPIVIESTTHLDDSGGKVAFGTNLAHNGAEMDIVYKSEVETGCDYSKTAPKGESCFRIKAIAPAITLPSLSTSVFVAPGQSVVFPIELAHVEEYVNLYVLYNFSWEFSGKYFSHFPHYDSQHRAYYGWFKLGKAMKSEREKKTVG